LREIVNHLRLLFLTLREQLVPSTRLKIIQCIFIVLKKGFIDPIESLDLFMEIFGFEDKQLRNMVFLNLAHIIKTLVETKKF
jgi:hypothetical protein